MTDSKSLTLQFSASCISHRMTLNPSQPSLHLPWPTVPLMHHPQGRDRIEEEDLYAAMENKAMESFSEMTASPKPGQDIGVPDPIPEELRRAIAVYEAGKVLTAYITPEFEEIARVRADSRVGWALWALPNYFACHKTLVGASFRSKVFFRQAAHTSRRSLRGLRG